MKNLFGKLAIVAVTAGFLIFFASDSLAKNPVRPFHLNGTGTDIALAPECDGGDLINETGNATHMGLYHAVACAFVIGSQSPTVLVIAGSGVTTAANGDQINFSFTGTTDVGGAVWLSDVTLTFAGGTGRFTNASGQTRYMASRAAFAVPYTASATGTLAY